MDLSDPMFTITSWEPVGLVDAIDQDILLTMPAFSIEFINIAFAAARAADPVAKLYINGGPSHLGSWIAIS